MSSHANESYLSETYSNCQEEVLDSTIHDLLSRVHTFNDEIRDRSLSDSEDLEETTRQQRLQNQSKRSLDSICDLEPVIENEENSILHWDQIRELLEQQRHQLEQFRQDLNRKDEEILKKSEQISANNEEISKLKQQILELETQNLSLKEINSNQSDQLNEDDQLGPLNKMKSRCNILEPEGLDLPTNNPSSFSRPSLANAVRERRNKKMSVRDMARAFSVDKK